MKNEIEIRKAFELSKTYTEVSERLDCKFSSANMKRYEKKYNIDTKHFTQSRGQIEERSCLMCGNKFFVRKREKKTTCGYSCANKYFRRNQKEETKKKISETLNKFHDSQPKPIKLLGVCEFCGKEFHKKNSKMQYCSVECVRKSPLTRKKLSDKVQERIQNGTHQGWISRNILSFPEKYFKSVFEQNGFSGKFITNYPVKKRDLGIKNDACYFLDFYFPDLKLDVEIDGKQHDRAEHIEHDKMRDQKLSENGYEVYRIKWKSLQNEKEYFKEEIKKILEILSQRFFNSLLSV